MKQSSLLAGAGRRITIQPRLGILFSLAALAAQHPVLAQYSTTSGYPGSTTTTGTTTTGTTTTGTTTGTSTPPPALAIHVVWTPNSTLVPAPKVAATQGPLGGVTRLHVSFPVPANAMGINLYELRIHEGAGHLNDQGICPVPNSTAPGAAMNSYADPLCGDPDANNPSSPRMAYYDVDWPTVEGHNGGYTVTATVHYQLYPSGAPSSPTTSIGVDVENLLITGTKVHSNMSAATPPAGSPAPVSNNDTDNPIPIFWYPATMSSVTLSAPVTAAYVANQPVVVTISNSDQSVVKVLRPPLPAGAAPTTTPTMLIGGNYPTPVTIRMDWDGTGDKLDASGAPIHMPKGIYLYKWEVGRQGYHQDYDTDKSQFLQVLATDNSVERLSDDGATAVFRVSYSLTSALNRPATSGRVEVYDPTNALVFTQSLSDSALGDSNLLMPGPHVFTFTMPSPEYAGEYIFLISVLDNHADKDKGHRLRWALQYGPDPPYSGTIAYSHSDMNPHGGYFYHSTKKLGYKRLSGYAWWYGNPSFDQIKEPLELYDAGAKPLKVVLFSGHGSGDSLALVLSGNPKQSAANSLRVLVPTGRYVFEHPWVQKQDYLILASIEPVGRQPLSNLDLVVLCGCSQAGGGLGSEFLALGAKCVVMAGGDNQVTNITSIWLDGPTGHPEQGFVSLLATMSIRDAAYAAQSNTTNYLQSATTAGSALGNGLGEFAMVVQGPGQNSVIRP